MGDEDRIKISSRKKYGIWQKEPAGQFTARGGKVHQKLPSIEGSKKMGFPRRRVLAVCRLAASSQVNSIKTSEARLVKTE